MDSLAARLLNDRVASPEELRSGKARNIVLMPAGVVEQLERHIKPASEFEKFFQALNAPFRFAVLAQPRWLTGNFIEPYIIRMTTTGSGLNVFGLARDLTATRRLLKRMEGSQDPRIRDAAAQIRAQQFGGLFVGNRSASVYRSAEQDFPVLYGKIISRLPVIREGFDFMRLIGRTLMKPGNMFFRATGSSRASRSAASSASASPVTSRTCRAPCSPGGGCTARRWTRSRAGWWTRRRSGASWRSSTRSSASTRGSRRGAAGWCRRSCRSSRGS
jgi:hypothetical protein